jgi:hypothetical protein
MNVEQWNHSAVPILVRFGVPALGRSSPGRWAAG